MYLPSRVLHEQLRSLHILLDLNPMTNPIPMLSPCSTTSTTSNYGLNETPKKDPSDHPDPDWPSLEILPITIPTAFMDGNIMWTDEWINLRARGRPEIDELLSKGQTTACAEIPKKYSSMKSPDSPNVTRLGGGGASPRVSWYRHHYMWNVGL